MLNAKFRLSLQRYFTRRVGNNTEVEDMVQQVFERLLKRGNVTEMEHVAGYVFQTASSVLADHLRKRRTHHADFHDEFDERSHADVDFCSEHVLLERERLAQAIAVLLELPERTREIFVLRRLEGMKYLDIAARLGVSVSTAEKQMEHAIRRLAESADQE